MAWEKLAACSKAEASKHILGYYSLLFYCSAQLTHCCILIVSPSINRYVPVSTRVRPVSGLYSPRQSGGPHSGNMQRCHCLLTWCWCKMAGRWVDPWLFGWPPAYTGRASPTASTQYSQTHQSPCLHAACKQGISKSKSIGRNGPKLNIFFYKKFNLRHFVWDKSN